jgi:hypothetical protein
MIKMPTKILIALASILLTSCSPGIEKFTEIDRVPVIFPDYTGIVIPPNIAPLNFMINEPGKEFEVRAFITKEKEWVIRSKSPSICFEMNKWHRMLKEGTGSKLYIEVFAKQADGNWQKFQTITNEISSDSIDNHLAYRLINTVYVYWNTLGIYQRNLENFDEKPIIENKSVEFGCINCHSFNKNNPDDMMIHIRAIHGGTILSQNGKLSKIDTKSKFTLSAGVYPSWHPDGKHIAFSVNNINQFFATGEVRIEVADEYSDLVIYDIETNTIITSPKVSTENRENLPIWSPDGKYLYFTSAPPAKELDGRIHSQYKLLRIAFDVNTNTWGDVDSILTLNEPDKSISFPKISPNGKFLMFCLSDYGYFTIHHPMADLYMLNLETHQYRKMEINSPQTDSYHCFSSSGKWFVFSSKRMDGLFTRPYFSHLDGNGNASKPFVMPQKDPEFYNKFVKNYNVPELITGEVKASALEIRDKILEVAVPAKIDPSVDTVFMKAHLGKSKK